MTGTLKFNPIVVLTGEPENDGWGSVKVLSKGRVPCGQEPHLIRCESNVGLVGVGLLSTPKMYCFEACEPKYFEFQKMGSTKTKSGSK